MHIPVHDNRYQFSDCLRLTRIQTCVQWPPRMVVHAFGKQQAADQQLASFGLQQRQLYVYVCLFV